MRVLVIGSGAREHALSWRLSKDPGISEVMTAPGNPGCAQVGRTTPADLSSPKELLALADRERVDLTVVGPEAPLDRGVSDAFRQAGRPIVGPTRAGAALECSKAFAKAFMQTHGVPTARFAVCDNLTDALEAVAGSRFGFPVVVKADGLAGGKGVVIAADRAEAERAVRAAMVDAQFGAAGSRLVIEECLSGPEVSFFVLADGEHAIPFGTAQDHKRLGDGDRGPNTGGMGAFATSPLASPVLESEVMSAVVQPVLAGMRAEGSPYRGFLYVSLMLTVSGPKVIEFNVRFGDPEAQVVLPLIEGSLSELLMASATGRLAGQRAQVSSDRAVGVVLASRGYPATSESGRVIAGLDRAQAMPGVLVFHAATQLTQAGLVTAGGRVLTVVGRGPSFETAMSRAYAGVEAIHFDGMQYRRDIGQKALVPLAQH
ncbi:MAG TPA: phosphoribosylamine--glycine ligase [Vicinamibacterales bacterium]|nr:phosphoribosylamine--glycine ligase [Vicinamibacterales bacterium]